MLQTGMIADPAELADRLAIQDVLAVHCRGVDRADEACLKAAYWEDAEVAYGGFNGPAHRFCEALPISIKRFAHTQHSISNVIIRFSDAQTQPEEPVGNASGLTRDGERRYATVETYVTAYHYLAGDAAAGQGAQNTDSHAESNAESNKDGDTEMTFLGRYLDRFERRGRCWKILHRRVLMDWNQNTAASAIWEGPPFDGLAKGTRHPEDPVYALFER